MTVAALEVAALCGAGPRMDSEIDVAAEHLEALRRRVGPRRGRATAWPSASRCACTAASR